MDSLFPNTGADAKMIYPGVKRQPMNQTFSGNKPGSFTPSQQDFLLGRQPIFNKAQQLMGYELLFRPNFGSISSVDGDIATTQVILNTFSEIGLKNLVGDRSAFINLTRSFLTGYLPIPFPPQQSVLEVLEDILIDKQLVDALVEMRRKGFTIALDDTIRFNRVQPLIGIAQIVKVDLPEVPKNELSWLVRQIRENGIYPLAEKVETQEEYRYCRSIGFELFQGYFFSKPSIIRGSKIDASRMVILHALAMLQNPAINFHQLEDIITRDVTLTYKLLKLSNSAFYSQMEKVNSVSQTISLIGMTQLSGWLTLMLIDSLDNKPHELTTTAMTRAKYCELLGKRLGYPDTNTLFMVGLFSVLDALFDKPMDQILTSLPITQEVQEALVLGTGFPALLIQSIRQSETGNFGPILETGLSAESIRSAYLEAIHWSDEIIKSTEIALASPD